MKLFKKFAAVLLILILIVCCMLNTTAADVGNAFADGDGGGGGGDWGGFDDWGDDADNSWSDGSTIFIGGDGMVGVVVIIIVGLVIFAAYKRQKGTGHTAQPHIDNSQGEPVMPEQTVVETIRAHDPGFSAEAFKAFAQDCYLRLQEAWEAKDWARVRPLESDRLFAIHEQQLRELIDGKRTNHMDAQCILKTELVSTKLDGQREILVVRLNATLLDYVTDDTTGKLLDGSKTERKNRTYRLEFIRTAGVLTDTGVDLTSHECPCCGAPVEVNATGHCAYCRNVITSGKFGWVMNEYTRWN